MLVQASVHVLLLSLSLSFSISLLPPHPYSQAYWYRRGQLEPRFRTMIYYNAAVTLLLCVTANLYFFQVGFKGVPNE